MTKALRKLIESLPRYKNFTLLDESKPFNEFFKNQSFDCVQVHCIWMVRLICMEQQHPQAT